MCGVDMGNRKITSKYVEAVVNISQNNINYLTGPEMHESFMAVGIIVLYSPNLFLWGFLFFFKVGVNFHLNQELQYET